jgi:ComF family protein
MELTSITRGWISALGHLFYPHTCAGCGNDLPDPRQCLCLHCLSVLPETGFAACPDNPVEKLFWGRLSIEAACSQFYFTRGSVMQSVIHRIKYRGDRETGRFMGRLMGSALKRSGRFRNIDVILPLPLFADRERKRGYNQSALLAEGISEVTGIPSDHTSVIRHRYTETQTSRGRVERWQNVEGVFRVNPAFSSFNGNVLLVDDVVTTGATLEACGAAICRAGPIRLSMATLACTVQ